MIRAYRLYTGPDGNSHVAPGSVSGGELVDAKSVEFKETAAHSSFDWHKEPTPQYVITLAGVLEYTMVGGETLPSVRVTCLWQRTTPVQGTNGV